MRALLFFLVFICVLNPVRAGEAYSAKIVAVLDGDTVLILRGSGQPFKVRLAHMDAPEMAQEYGMASRQSLAQLVLNKQVQVSTLAIDAYGRVVAIVGVDGRNISQEQVWRGMAWADSRSQGSNMLLAQNEAREARRGLWAQRDPLRPDLWRKRHAVLPHNVEQDSACADKHRCVQMSSCEEAKFHLMHCGVKSLDSDGDGMPCESLCMLEQDQAE